MNNNLQNIYIENAFNNFNPHSFNQKQHPDSVTNQLSNTMNLPNFANIQGAKKPTIKKELIGRYLMEKMGWKGQGIFRLNFS